MSDLGDASLPSLKSQSQFHDSIRVRISRMYGPDRLYEHRVKCFVDKLKDNSSLHVFDLPFGDGVTFVRKVRSTGAV